MAAEFEPCVLRRPAAPAIPLVCDSPHSGTRYPADFGHALARQHVRRGEDTHVDTLWDAVPAAGGTLLAATFPRTYIDANRDLGDLDPDLLDDAWPEPLSPGAKTRLGHGLVWRDLDPGQPLYARRLTVAEVRGRIDGYYRPYHAALSGCIDDAVRRFGAVWHLNLHSMPSDAYERLGLPGRALADFVLGDRDGSTCEPGLLAVIESVLHAHGHTVARNDPYKGVELIRRMGQPALGRHSLQIEVNRRLYMDEATRERHGGYAPLKAAIDAVVRAVADHVRDRIRDRMQDPMRANMSA